MIDRFLNALKKDGYVPVRAVVGDTKGRWERLLFDKEKRSSGRYVFFEDGNRAVAIYGSSKDVRGFQVWRSWDGEKVSDFDYARNQKWMEQRRAEIDAKEAARQDRLAKRLSRIYYRMEDAHKHEYLDKKRLYCAERLKYRARTNELIVPVVDSEGMITSVQKIGADGSKWFLRGGRVKGGFCPLKQPDDVCETIYVCEGYATGASIREIMGEPVFIAFNAGNLLPVCQWLRSKYPKAVIVVAGDNDCWGKDNVGLKKAQQAAGAVGGFAVVPDETLLEKGETDWNDVYVRHGRDVVYNGLAVYAEQKQVAEQPPHPLDAAPVSANTDWREDMRWKDNAVGTILDSKHSLWNALLYLPNNDRWKGTFVYDEFDQTEKVVRPLPWDKPETFVVREVSEADLTQMRAEMSLVGISVKANKEMNNILEAVAQKNSVHPVRQWFDNLKWDGEPRLDTWAVRYLGAISQPQDFVEAVSRCWIIAAVKRIYEPGAPFHHMLVLEGAQGAGKSSFLKSMATFGDVAYFTDNMTFGHIRKSQEAANLMRGSIVIEFGEMTGKSSTDNEHIKQWLAQTHDEYTPKFSNKPFKQPRQCVFAASTNADDYLTDGTGGRRFWPIRVGRIDQSAFECVREQIWAEAVQRYKAGELWYIAKDDPVYDLMESQQVERSEDNVWVQTIGEWISEHPSADGYSLATILERACLVPRERVNERKYVKQASDALRKLGFDNRVTWVNGKASRKWVVGDTE